MTINPYHPPPMPDVDGDLRLAALERIVFDGAIERIDYEALLPSRRVLWWLQAVLLVMLMPVTVGSILIAAFIFATDSARLEALVFVGSAAVSLALSLFCFATMRNGWRSRMYLLRFPDLIGVARGEFSRDGLLTHDGTRLHWIGPSGLSTANVSKAGIRVPLPGPPCRYLAFTSRLFDSYNLSQAEQLLAVWRKKAARLTPGAPNPLANLWPLAAEPPTGTVQFKGYCTVQEPLKSSAEIKERVWGETVVLVVMVAVAICFINDRSAIFWGAVVLASLIGYTCFRTWRQYLYGTIQRSWYQYGWVSGSQLAMCNNEWGTLFELSEIAKVEVSSSLLALTTHTNNRQHIFREQVADDAAWLRLSELLSKLTTQ